MTENDVSLIVFDMGHINKILKEKKINFIDGIIGGDILIKYNACIDYDKGFLILNF